MELAPKNGDCFVWLQAGHCKADCALTTVCGGPMCSARHHKLLHCAPVSRSHSPICSWFTFAEPLLFRGVLRVLSAPSPLSPVPPTAGRRQRSAFAFPPRTHSGHRPVSSLPPQVTCVAFALSPFLSSRPCELGAARPPPLAPATLSLCRRGMLTSLLCQFVRSCRHAPLPPAPGFRPRPHFAQALQLSLSPRLPRLWTRAAASRPYLGLGHFLLRPMLLCPPFPFCLVPFPIVPVLPHPPRAAPPPGPTHSTPLWPPPRAPGRCPRPTPPLYPSSPVAAAYALRYPASPHGAVPVARLLRALPPCFVPVTSALAFLIPPPRLSCPVFASSLAAHASLRGRPPVPLAAPFPVPLLTVVPVFPRSCPFPRPSPLFPLRRVLVFG
ncbi:hypothetical protein FGIG_04361 [Fasciola gigantica]|uniref:Uncharacterized protein n=1 Tax=Fasciola gigantica TaxID=46835 RepID=A0A504YLX3_FASGI|nr:hypothetical protein FGIG_04361 [Fasciola gigantica]